MFELGVFRRSWVDFAGIALAGAILAGLVGFGVYGSFLGFVQTVGYYRANDVVAVVAGVIGAGCALYLMLELLGRPNGRQVLGVCVVSFLFSVFAVTKGVPASLSILHGKPSTERFDVTAFSPGGRSCSRTVVAVNPKYEEFRTCADGLTERLKVGGVIEISGPATEMGIVRQRVIVLR